MSSPSLFGKAKALHAAHQVHTVSRNASETEPLRFVIAYTVKQGEAVTFLPA
jgi:hypothetical protein